MAGVENKDIKALVTDLDRLNINPEGPVPGAIYKHAGYTFAYKLSEADRKAIAGAAPRSIESNNEKTFCESKTFRVPCVTSPEQGDTVLLFRRSALVVSHGSSPESACTAMRAVWLHVLTKTGTKLPEPECKGGFHPTLDYQLGRALDLKAIAAENKCCSHRPRKFINATVKFPGAQAILGPSGYIHVTGFASERHAHEVLRRILAMVAPYMGRAVPVQAPRQLAPRRTARQKPCGQCLGYSRDCGCAAAAPPAAAAAAVVAKQIN